MKYMDIIASVYRADDETSSTLVMTPFHFHLTHRVVASIYQTDYIFLPLRFLEGNHCMYNIWKLKLVVVSAQLSEAV